MKFKISYMFSTVNQNMYFTDFLECIALQMNFYLIIYFVINKLKLKKKFNFHKLLLFLVF